MADYSGLSAGDDQYAPEHINALAAAAPVDEYIDFGLNVTTNGDGTITIAEGKFYIILDEALAEWTDDSGTSHSQTVHNALMYGHTDSRTKDLATTTDTNYVFAWVNYQINDDPRIFVNASGSPTPPGQSEEADDVIEIARVDPVSGEVDPQNQYPSGVFGSFEVQDQFTDPADVVHTGEMADAEDIRTDSEINAAVNAYDPHATEANHDYYDGEQAIIDLEGHPDPIAIDISGEAGSVAGNDVTGSVPEADHAAEADNADTVGNIPPDNFLRTDTRDQMFADADWNDHRIENLSGLTFSSSSGVAIDLRPNSDGSHYVVQHDDPATGEEFGWQSNPGGGWAFQIERDGEYLFRLGTEGALRLPQADVYSQEGRLASQQWANDKFLPLAGGEMTGPLDLGGEALVGLAGMQAAGSEVTVRDDLHANESVYINPQVGDSPEIDLAIGDNDTGFSWINDGILGFFSNGDKLLHLAPEPDAVRFANKIGMADDIRMIENNITETNRIYFHDVGNDTDNNYVYFENGELVVNPQGGTTRRY